MVCELPVQIYKACDKTITKTHNSEVLQMRFVTAAVLMLLPLAARAQDTLWTPQHVAKLRIVTEAVISPDGTQVAYVLAVPRDLTKEKDGTPWTELHLVDTKGNS